MWNQWNTSQMLVVLLYCSANLSSSLNLWIAEDKTNSVFKWILGIFSFGLLQDYECCIADLFPILDMLRFLSSFFCTAIFYWIINHSAEYLCYIVAFIKYYELLFWAWPWYPGTMFPQNSIGVPQFTDQKRWLIFILPQSTVRSNHLKEYA